MTPIIKSILTEYEREPAISESDVNKDTIMCQEKKNKKRFAYSKKVINIVKP